MRKIVLCADEESLCRPALIGLEGESLDQQEWLTPISKGEDARSYLQRDRTADEVWVASSEDVDPINLAAAIKRDGGNGRPVYLLAFQESGSLKSRVAAAGLDGILDYKEMARKYALHKQRSRAFAVGGETVSMEPLRTDETLEKKPHTSSAPTAAGQSAYVLTVASASGGTGKSTISVLSALYCQKRGLRTLLIDADFQFGDAAAMLGAPAPLTIDQAIAMPEKLSLLKGEGGRPALLSIPDQMEKSEAVVGALPALLEKLKSRFDTIVINTGSFWTEQHIQLLEASTNTLFLLDQRPSSIRAGKRALELCARCGAASQPFLFAVNRCSKNGLVTSIDISCALKGVFVAELKDGGREVEEMTGSGLSADLVGSRNELCTSLETFLLNILPSTLLERTGGKEWVKTTQTRGLSLMRRRRKSACL